MAVNEGPGSHQVSSKSRPARDRSPSIILEKAQLRKEVLLIKDVIALGMAMGKYGGGSQKGHRLRFVCIADKPENHA